MNAAVLVLLLWMQPPAENRATAWDRSVAAEVQGDLDAAEDILRKSFGETPDNYFIRLRMAYLALLQERWSEAEARYTALLAVPEAKGDEDVTRGLALAREKRRPYPRPPIPVVIPEAWTGVTLRSLGRTRIRGLAFYAQAPLRITQEWTLRPVFRHIWSHDISNPSPWAFGAPDPAHIRIDEEYLSLARESKIWGMEIIGVRLAADTLPSTLGGAGRVRLGSAWGLALESVILRQAKMATHFQLRPMLFLAKSRRWVVSAGVRLTHDDQGWVKAVNLGSSYYVHPLALHLDGHLGTERWAMSTLGPQVKWFDEDSTLGGSITLYSAITARLGVFLQAEGDRLTLAGAKGAYANFSVGVQYALGSHSFP